MRKKLTDQEALNELQKWCNIFGLEIRVNLYDIKVIWIDPENIKDGISVVISESRPKLKSSTIFLPRTRSISTTCDSIIKKFFKNKKYSYLYWGKKRYTQNGIFEIENFETCCIHIPEANSPEEMELKLTIKGWTGNPFGLSAGILNPKIFEEVNNQ